MPTLILPNIGDPIKCLINKPVSKNSNICVHRGMTGRIAWTESITRASIFYTCNFSYPIISTFRFYLLDSEFTVIPEIELERPNRPTLLGSFWDLSLAERIKYKSKITTTNYKKLIVGNLNFKLWNEVKDHPLLTGWTQSKYELCFKNPSRISSIFSSKDINNDRVIFRNNNPFVIVAELAEVIIAGKEKDQEKKKKTGNYMEWEHGWLL